MEWLQNLLDSSTVPALTALLVGLLTALSPCPLATNIAAIGYISRDIGDRRRIFARGIAYTLGRVLSYTMLGVVLLYLLSRSIDTFGLQSVIAEYGSLVIGPMLVVVGVLMLFGHKLRLPGVNAGGGERLAKRGYWGALLLGVLFALAFCPSSGVLYFGVLIPLAMQSTAGWLLLVVFAVATAVPVLVVAWVIAFSMNKIGRVYDRLQSVQRWLNLIVGVLFIIIGLYYCYIIYF